jgi:hypothetical protein
LALEFGFPGRSERKGAVLTFNSAAKEVISRRTPAKKRDRIRKYAEAHGLTYSAAEERLLDRGLSAERQTAKDVLGDQLPPEANALFFGDQDGAPAEPGRKGSPFATWDELVAAWDHWRGQTKPPHKSWWAHWSVDHSLSAKQANARADAARSARVTDKTGESWTEQTKGGQWLVFFYTDEAA